MSSRSRSRSRGGSKERHHLHPEHQHEHDRDLGEGAFSSDSSASSEDDIRMRPESSSKYESRRRYWERTTGASSSKSGFPSPFLSGKSSAAPKKSRASRDRRRSSEEGAVPPPPPPPMPPKDDDEDDDDDDASSCSQSQDESEEHSLDDEEEDDEDSRSASESEESQEEDDASEDEVERWRGRADQRRRTRRHSTDLSHDDDDDETQHDGEDDDHVEDLQQRQTFLSRAESAVMQEMLRSMDSGDSVGDDQSVESSLLLDDTTTKQTRRQPKGRVTVVDLSNEGGPDELPNAPSPNSSSSSLRKHATTSATASTYTRTGTKTNPPSPPRPPLPAGQTPPTANLPPSSTLQPSSSFGAGAGASAAAAATLSSTAKPEDLSSGMLPDVLMTMREKIESLSLFDSDMIRLVGSTASGVEGTMLPPHAAPGTAPGGVRTLGTTTANTPGGGIVSLLGTTAENYDNEGYTLDEDDRASKESLRRTFQQSISAAVLVSLAHKRYERRRLAAMEIEKVVRSLVAQGELERVRAILLLLADDYVRSTSEDARKGGVVALAACEIGLKKASDVPLTTITTKGGKGTGVGLVAACKDMILASVVHACQDHSQRVRYYATESLFNVVKVVPAQAVQHFFILFEILRSLYADVDHDVRSGAQLLDKKLKEIVVAAVNGGSFAVEACVPLFARFVYAKNKPTKRLTLTWLQEFSEKLVGSPLLEYLHLFLGGVFGMIADPSPSIRQLALSFLQTVLPKLLMTHGENLGHDVFEYDEEDEDDEEDEEDEEVVGEEGAKEVGLVSAKKKKKGRGRRMQVDFDKILQSLVTIMEHPDPFVRKVAMYWMSQIVQAHVGGPDHAGSGAGLNAVGVGGRKGTEADEGGGVEVAVDSDGGARVADSEGRRGNVVDGKSPAGRFRGQAGTGELSSKLSDSGKQLQHDQSQEQQQHLSPASISVRNSLPHVLPGILLSIGDAYHARASSSSSPRDSYFVPSQTTHSLAQQTNACLQDVVRRDGAAFVSHLDGFVITLLEELDSPGGLGAARHVTPAVERKPYRMDVKPDGSGIESTGWFRSAPPATNGADGTSGDHASSGDQHNHHRQQQQQHEAHHQHMMMSSRLCALEWIIVLYESVVPDSLKAEYAREFISPVVHQFVYNPPEVIIRKSLQVLAKVTTPVQCEILAQKDRHRDASREGDDVGPVNELDYRSVLQAYERSTPSSTTSLRHHHRRPHANKTTTSSSFSLFHQHARDRKVFEVLIDLYARHPRLLTDLSSSRVIEYMCTLQPPEFVFVSFALEVDAFVSTRMELHARKWKESRQPAIQEEGENINAASNGVKKKTPAMASSSTSGQPRAKSPFARDLDFVSSFVQQMNIVLLTAKETAELRAILKDAVVRAPLEPRTTSDQRTNGTVQNHSSSSHYRYGESVSSSRKNHDEMDEDLLERRKSRRLFHILLHSFSHNFVAALALCLWGGAYRTASIALHQINPVDIDLIFYLEIDQLIELLERPLFRHVHYRMLEREGDLAAGGGYGGESEEMAASMAAAAAEGSGAMLFRALKSILMLLPQSTSYSVLRDRLLTVAKYRQTAMNAFSFYGGNRYGGGHPYGHKGMVSRKRTMTLQGTLTNVYISRIRQVRVLHCSAKWQTIRTESLEKPSDDALFGTAVDSSGGVAGENAADKDKERTIAQRQIHGSSHEEESGDGSGAPLLRHPDEVLPKDQVTNFQALKSRGLIHQAQHRNVSSSVGGKNLGNSLLGTRQSSRGLLAGGESGDLSTMDGAGHIWKDFWLHPNDT